MNDLPKAFGKIPLGAATVIADAISIIRTIGLNGLALIAKDFKNSLTGHLSDLHISEKGQEEGKKFIQGLKDGINNDSDIKDIDILKDVIEQAKIRQEELKEIAKEISNFDGLIPTENPTLGTAEIDNTIWIDQLESWKERLIELKVITPEVGEAMMKMAPPEVTTSVAQLIRDTEEMGNKAEEAIQKINQSNYAKLGGNLSNIGAALNVISNALDKTSESGRIFAGSMMAIGGALKGIGSVIKYLNTEGMAFPWMAVAMGAITLINGISTIIETPEEKLERLNKEAENLSNIAKQVKADQKTLQTGIDKVKELEKTRYDSAEAAEEYQNSVENLADSFPELIRGFDEAGNVIIDLDNGEEMLAEARRNTAKATYDAAKAEQEAAQQQVENTNKSIREGFLELNSEFQGDSEGLGRFAVSDAGQARQSARRRLYLKSLKNIDLDGTLSQPLEVDRVSALGEQGFFDQIKSLGDFQNILSSYNGEEGFNNFKKDLANTQSELYSALSNFGEDTLSDFRETFGVAINDPKEDAFAQIQTLFEELSSMEDFSTDEAKEKAQNLRKAIIDFNNNFPDDKTFSSLLGTNGSLTDLIDQMSQLQSSNRSLQNYTRSTISQWLQLGEAFDDAWKNIEQTDDVLGLLANQLYNIQKTGDYKTLAEFENAPEVQQAIEDFRNGYATLNNKQREALLSMQKSSKSFTQQEVIGELEKLSDKPLDEAINKAVEASFSNGAEQLQRVKDAYLELLSNTGWEKATASLEKYAYNLNSDDVSVGEADFIINQLKQINTLSKQGLTNTAQTLANQTQQLIGHIQNLTGLDKGAAIDILKSTNLQTKEGIDEAITQFQNLNLPDIYKNLIIEDLESRKQAIIDNVALSLNADLEQLLSDAENDSKILSKITSGMTVKEANELIQKAKEWGINDLTIGEDLIPNGDKLIISEQAYVELQQKYKEYIDKAANQAQNDLVQAREAGLLSEDGKWVSVNNLNELNQAQKEFFEKQSEGFIKNADFWNNGELTEEGRQEAQRVIDSINLALSNYVAGAGAIYASIFENPNWAKGDYSSLNLQKEVGATGKYIFDSDSFKKYLTGELKYNASEDPQLKRAVDSARKGVSEFLDNLLNVGVEDFNLSDYENIGIEQGIYKNLRASLVELQNGIITYEQFIQEYGEYTGKTADEIDSLMVQAHNKDYAHNIYEAFNNLVNTYDEFSYEAAQAFLRSVGDMRTPEQAFGKADVAGNFSQSYEQMSAFLDWKLEELGNKKYNELRAQLEKKQRDLSDTSILSTIIQNRDKLSEENVESLANLFEMTYDQAESLLNKNSDGTYSIGVAKLQTFIKTKGLELNSSLQELLASQIDGIISSITGLAGSQSKGFTDLASMQKFVSRARDTGLDVNFQSLFDYDNTLHAYRLSTQGLISQIQILNGELLKLSGEEKEVAQQLIQDTTRQFAEAIDFSSFIEEIGTGTTINRDAFMSAIHDYNTALAALAENDTEVIGLNAEAIRDALYSGGQAAVDAGKAIAEAQGKTLTAEQVETLYRGQINNFVNAIDTIVAKPGEIVDSATANLIKISGGKVSELNAAGQAVVLSAANLYDAYSNLYNILKDSGEATLADLNKVAGLALDNKDNQQTTIDALGDAANLTYSRLGEIFTSANKLMTKELIAQWTESGLIKALGGNKIQITDFAKFAELMDFDTGSPEYVSAFKSYNDSLIEMNRQAEHNILEEAQNVASAKSGDWINLTQLADKLQSTFESGITSTGIEFKGQDLLTKLNNKLANFGAYIEDGILKITDSADIISIMQAVQDAAEQSGGLISSEMAELADAIADAIKGYADLIKGSIEGSLSETQANSLQQFADSRGLGKIDFSRTETGLKASERSATKLYFEISKIDAIQGKLVFDALRSSLEASNGQVANISKTTNAITNIQNKMRANAAEIAKLEKEGAEQTKIDKINQENKGLQQQLNLYKQIANAQSSDPEQFNFMNRSMPDSFQGPINYWDSVGKAYSVMNEAAKTKKMGIQDFYNIVQEMSNTAAMSGQELELMGFKIDGSAENAAALIQKGFNALSNVDGSGVKIDLAKLGADISGGAANMAKGFDTGIKSMAQSQIKMLDAAINMLEAIVAMENIDVNGDNFLDLSEIFKNGENLDEGFTKPVEDWLTKLETLSGGIEIGGQTFREALESLEPDQIQNLLNQLFSIDWTLGDTDVFGQIQNILSAFFPGQSITKGESIFDILKVPKNAEKDSEEFKKWLTDMGLNADQAEILFSAMEGDFLELDLAGPLGQAIKKMLGVTKEFDNVFSDFIQDGRIDSEEIKMWSNIDITTDAKTGEVTGTYTASDGSVLTLKNPASSWKDQIIKYEEAILIEQTSGGAVSKEKALAGNADIKTLEIPGGSYEVVVEEDTTGAKFWTTFNGKRIGPCSSETELQGKIQELIEAQESGGAHYQLDESGNIIYDADGNVKVEYDWHYKKGLTPEQKTQVTEDARKLADEIRKGTELEIGKDYEQSGDKITIKSLPGIEFEASAILGEDGKIDYSKLSEALKTITGEDNSISQAIVEGIKTALTGENSKFGEVLSTAIANAFTNLKDLDEQEIPELKAKITNLQITGVENTTFGAAGLLGGAIRTIFGGSDLTIPEATAKIGLLKLTEATDVDTSQITTVGEQIAKALQEALNNHHLIPIIDTPTGGEKSDDGDDNGSGGGAASLTSLTAPNLTTLTASSPSTINAEGSTITGTINLGKKDTGNTTTDNKNDNGSLSLDLSSLETALTGITELSNSAAGVISGIVSSINDIKDEAINNVKKAAEEIDSRNAENAQRAINEISPNNAQTAASYIKNIDPSGAQGARNAINAIKAPSTLSTTLKATLSKAKGNIGGFAHVKGTGVALAGGQKTLMGELGPELVVSNGRYYIVGENGAEFVSLDKDAIVFNHLQTRRLMEQGAIGSRGRPTTNERAAVSLAKGRIPLNGRALEDPTVPVETPEPQKVSNLNMSPTDWEMDLFRGTLTRVSGDKSISFAKGNMSGPAMASASEALAALKQLRAMWQSLLNASLKDLGAMPGGSGGGGGGGGENKDKYIAGILKDVEEWYNWLTKIESVQQDINKLTKEYSLLEKQGGKTEAERNKNLNDRLKNLEGQYKKRSENQQTRQTLAKKQTASREKLLQQVRGEEKGEMNALQAFYTVGDDGRLYLRQDTTGYADYLYSQGGLTKKQRNDLKAGKSVSMTVKQQQAYTAEEAKAYNKKHKKDKNFQEVKAGDLKGTSKKVKINLPKSGLELMNELQKKDEYGNLIYSAQNQYEMLKKLGFADFMSRDANGDPIDTSTDEGRAKAVENFFEKIETGKTTIDDLTSSIEEQEQAALDDAIAMEEINDTIIEITSKVAGVTEGLDKWYNYTKQIELAQRELNKLTKEYNNLQNDQVANGYELYANLMKQKQILQDEIEANKALMEARTKDNDALVASIEQNPILSRYFKFGYESDENGEVHVTSASYNEDYKFDNKTITGTATVLQRDKNGNILKDDNGKYLTEQKDYSFTANGNIQDVIDELTKTNLDGSVAYTAEQQFEILKQLGLSDLMLYDSSGNRIYNDISDITQENMKSAVEAAFNHLKEPLETVNENTDTIAKLNEDNLDLQGQILDIERQQNDLNKTIEEQMKESYVNQHQDEIDTRTELKEAIEDAASKTVDGLRDSLEKDRKLYEGNKNQDELKDLQSRLALLLRSSGSTSEIRNLQEQIAEKQKEMYFEEREAEIDAVEEAANKQVEQLQTQIDIMQSTLEWLIDKGIIWDEINTKLATWTAEEIASYIQTGTQDLATTPEERKQEITEGIKAAQQYVAGRDAEEVKKDINQFVSGELKKTNLGEQYSNEINNDAWEAYYNTNGDDSIRMAAAKAVAQKSIAANQSFENYYNDLLKGDSSEYVKTLDKEALRQKYVAAYKKDSSGNAKNAQSTAASGLETEYKFTSNEHKNPTPPAAPTAIDEPAKTTTDEQQQQQAAEVKEPEKVGGEAIPELPTSLTIITDAKTNKMTAEGTLSKDTKYFASKKVDNKTKVAGTLKAGENFIITGLSTSDSAYNRGKYKRHLLQIKVNKKTMYMPLFPSHIKEYDVKNTLTANKIKRFSQGGQINFTGPAWVDGTKNKPETIYNFEQMQALAGSMSLLRSELLDSIDLTSRMASVAQSTFKSISSSTTYSNETDSSINIEHLDVNVEVKEVSNDYDARRIGSQAIEEMVRIARKTGARSISRR